MAVNNRDIRFALTVQAACEIADMCPDGDFTKILELLKSGSYAERLRNAAKFVEIMARGYDCSLYGTNEAPQKLTAQKIQGIHPNRLWELAGAALQALFDGQGTTVEVEPSKKTEAPG